MAMGKAEIGIIFRVMKKRWMIAAGIVAVGVVGFTVVRPPHPGTNVRCPSCKIELTRVATIGEGAGPLSPRKEGTLSMSSRGEYALTRSHDLTRVVVYGPDGNIAASWGRKGGGPGEFEQIERVSWMGDDTLLVIDGGNRRLSIWLRDGTLVRETEFRDNGDILFRSDGLAYIHRRNPEGPMPRPPFLIWSSGENPVEFGDVGEVNEFTTRRLNSLATGLGRGDSLWVAEATQYQLTLYAPDGQRARSFMPDSRWFRGMPNKPSGLLLGLVRGTMDLAGDVTTDESGRIWLGVEHVYLRKWMQIARRPHGKGTPTPQEMDPVSDYVLEVLDPTTGEAISTRVFETGTFGGFIDRKYMWTVRELDDGQIVFDVWRFSLDGVDRARR